MASSGKPNPKRDRNVFDSLAMWVGDTRTGDYIASLFGAKPFGTVGETQRQAQAEDLGVEKASPENKEAPRCQKAECDEVLKETEETTLDNGRENDVTSDPESASTEVASEAEFSDDKASNQEKIRHILTGALASWLKSLGETGIVAVGNGSGVVSVPRELEQTALGEDVGNVGSQALISAGPLAICRTDSPWDKGTILKIVASDLELTRLHQRVFKVYRKLAFCMKMMNFALSDAKCIDIDPQACFLVNQSTSRNILNELLKMKPSEVKGESKKTAQEENVGSKPESASGPSSDGTLALPKTVSSNKSPGKKGKSGAQTRVVKIKPTKVLGESKETVQGENVGSKPEPASGPSSDGTLAPSKIVSSNKRSSNRLKVLLDELFEQAEKAGGCQQKTPKTGVKRSKGTGKKENDPQKKKGRPKKNPPKAEAKVEEKTEEDQEEPQEGSSDEPPSKVQRRRYDGATGMYNLGFTCYINAAVQSLLYVSPFRERLFALDLEQIDNEKNSNDTALQDANVPRCANRSDRKAMWHNRLCFSYQLRTMMRTLYESKQRTASPRKLYAAVLQKMKFSKDVQHDAAEFLSFTLNTLEEETEAGIRSDLFRGMYKNQMKCESCDYENTVEEELFELYLTFPPSEEMPKTITLEELLAHFQQSESLDMPCPSCKKTTVTRTQIISELPPVVILIFQRLSYVDVFSQKIQTHVAFKDRLDLGCFLEEKRAEMYELSSVVEHQGRLSEVGHYVTYVRRPHEGEEEWWELDDWRPRQVQWEEVEEVQAFMCLYTQVSMLPK